MNFETKTLVVFVAVVFLNICGLLFDLWLGYHGMTTITEHVWERPWLGTPIVLLQVVGAIAIALHFWGP